MYFIISCVIKEINFIYDESTALLFILRCGENFVYLRVDEEKNNKARAHTT